MPGAAREKIRAPHRLSGPRALPTLGRDAILSASRRPLLRGPRVPAVRLGVAGRRRGRRYDPLRVSGREPLAVGVHRSGCAVHPGRRAWERPGRGHPQPRRRHVRPRADRALPGHCIGRRRTRRPGRSTSPLAAPTLLLTSAQSGTSFEHLEIDNTDRSGQTLQPALELETGVAATVRSSLVNGRRCVEAAASGPLNIEDSTLLSSSGRRLRAARRPVQCAAQHRRALSRASSGAAGGGDGDPGPRRGHGRHGGPLRHRPYGRRAARDGDRGVRHP